MPGNGKVRKQVWQLAKFGVLVDITAFGTGFVEEESTGARYGFHVSMLPKSLERRHLRLLDGRSVRFTVARDGIVKVLELIMDYKLGRLTEVSPWGTGFIEASSGARFGFHYSMLPSSTASAEINWPTLESLPVRFIEEDGYVTSVLLDSPKIDKFRATA